MRPPRAARGRDAGTAVDGDGGQARRTAAGRWRGPDGGGLAAAGQTGLKTASPARTAMKNYREEIQRLLMERFDPAVLGRGSTQGGGSMIWERFGLVCARFGVSLTGAGAVASVGFISNVGARLALQDRKIFAPAASGLHLRRPCSGWHIRNGRPSSSAW